VTWNWDLCSWWVLRSTQLVHWIWRISCGENDFYLGIQLKDILLQLEIRMRMRMTRRKTSCLCLERWDSRPKAHNQKTITFVNRLDFYLLYWFHFHKHENTTHSTIQYWANSSWWLVSEIIKTDAQGFRIIIAGDKYFDL
jgi:hypothetical protein